MAALPLPGLIVATVVLVAGLIVVSRAIMGELAHLPSRAIFRAIVFPGVLLHELAHALACVATGTPVVEFNAWSETGGHVAHVKPGNPLAQPVISFAPFVVGMAVLLIMSQNLTGPWWQIILMAYLMIVVAATLAPSKADAVIALEGLFLAIILVSVLAWQFETVQARLTILLASLIRPLASVAAAMFLIWTGLHSFRRLLQRL